MNMSGIVKSGTKDDPILVLDNPQDAAVERLSNNPTADVRVRAHTINFDQDGVFQTGTVKGSSFSASSMNETEQATGGMYDSPTSVLSDGINAIPNTPCNTLQADGCGQSDQTNADCREATPYDTISSLASEITTTNNTGPFIMLPEGRTIVAEQGSKILILEYNWLGTNEEVDSSRNETCLTVEGHKFVARLKWSFVVPIELHTPKRCASVMTDTDEPLVEDEQRKKRRTA